MHDTPPAHTARVQAMTPSPGPDAEWTHPLMHRLLIALARVRDIDRVRPWLLDTFVVLLAAAAAPPDLLARDRPDVQAARLVGSDLPLALVVACGAALMVPLWWRRRAPATVTALLMPIGLLLWAMGMGPAAGLVVLIALFNLALHSRPRENLAVLPIAAAGWVLVVVFLMPTSNPAGFLVLSIGTGIAAVAVGFTLRIRRMYASAVEQSALQTRTEHDQRVRLAAAAERARIAHDMHDIVGHNLSIMVNLADGAATLTDLEPQRAQQALHIIGDTGREAMDELRRVLGVMREAAHNDPPMSPQPGISDIDALIARVRASGLSVQYRTTGPIDAAGPGVQLAAYRVVQEALTNTLKHAAPSTTSHVTLTSTHTHLHLRISDTGPPKPSAGNGEGQGIAGIRRRAALYEGTATAGPGPDDRGWIVEARFTLPTPHAPGAPHP